MRPTQKELDELFDRFNVEHFQGRIKKVPVIINERLSSTLGRAHWKYKWEMKAVLVGLRSYAKQVKSCVPVKVELSGPILDHYGWDYKRPDWSMTELHDTLTHEMTHLFLAEHHNDEGHSRMFHNIMSRITGRYGNHRCHKLSVAGIIVNKKVKKTQAGIIGGGFSLALLE